MKKTVNPKILCIRIKPELKTRVLEILQEEDISIAQLIRTLLKRYIQENNPNKVFLANQGKLRKIIDPL